MNTIDNDLPRAAVPADIGTPDRIAFGLTFRQLAILGGVGLAGFGLHHAFGALLPPSVWLIVGIPAAAATIVAALGRRDGLPLDVWLRHGLTLARAPRTLTPGQPRSTSVAAVAGNPLLPAPLRHPVTDLTLSGILTSEGIPRAVIACSTTNIHLRTGTEQASLVDGFGRFLNSLNGPVQMLVSARRHDLTPYAASVAAAAPRLPHPALRAAADDHTAFLLDLDASRDPLRRQVLMVVTGEQAADTATRALTGLGVHATVLDGPAVTAALAAAVDPFHPPVPGPRAVPGIPVISRS